MNACGHFAATLNRRTAPLRAARRRNSPETFEKTIDFFEFSRIVEPVYAASQASEAAIILPDFIAFFSMRPLLAATLRRGHCSSHNRLGISSND